MTSPAPCVHYYGGCDPNAVESVVRTVAKVSGLWPLNEWGAWMLPVLIIISMSVPVLLVDPIPDSWRQVSMRAASGLILLTVSAHIANFVDAINFTFTMYIAVTGLVIIGILGYMGLRAVKLIQTLRGVPNAK